MSDRQRAAGTLLVDARALHASGLGRYLRELLAAWLADPPFERMALLGDVDALRAFVGAPSGRVRLVPYAGAVYSPRAQAEWLARWARGATRATVGFFPHWDVPVVALPRRSVVAVHDLIHFRVPEAFSPARRALGAPMLRRAVRRAWRVVCPSEATARDVAAWLPDAAGKLRAVPNGVSARFFGAAGAPPAPGPYLLCVGNQKPHKNVEAAVDVVARLRDELPALRLVVAGQHAAPSPAARRAAALGIADAVVDLGAVDDDTLHACYAGAAALLFPSRYEGFGLPVVEAMAAGAPVVASSTPAVAEVVGGAAPVRDPDDVAGMAADVRRLLREPAWRAARVEAGRRRAAEFSWARAAATTADVLRAAASAGSVAERAAAPAGAAP